MPHIKTVQAEKEWDDIGQKVTFEGKKKVLRRWRKETTGRENFCPCPTKQDRPEMDDGFPVWLKNGFPVE